MSLMKTIGQSLAAAFALLAMLGAAGCGPVDATDAPLPEENAPPPTKASIVLSMSGTPEEGSAIGGLGVTVVLPDTVSVPLTDGAPDIGVVTASGDAADDTTILSLFTGATATAAARLSLVVAGGAAGLPVGEFATIIVDVKEGHRPVVSDFSLEDFSAVDAYGDRIRTLSAGMALSLQ